MGTTNFYQDSDRFVLGDVPNAARWNRVLFDLVQAELVLRMSLMRGCYEVPTLGNTGSLLSLTWPVGLGCVVSGQRVTVAGHWDFTGLSTGNYVAQIDATGAYVLHAVEVAGILTIATAHWDGAAISSVVPSALASGPGMAIQGIVGGSGGGDMLRSVYDTNDNGIVDAAEGVNDGAGHSAAAAAIVAAVGEAHAHTNLATLNMLSAALSGVLKMTAGVLTGGANYSDVGAAPAASDDMTLSGLSPTQPPSQHAVAAYVTAAVAAVKYAAQIANDTGVAGSGSSVSAMLIWLNSRVNAIVSGVSSVNGKTGSFSLTASDVGALATTLLGAASGVAQLDNNGQLLLTELPSSVLPVQAPVDTAAGTPPSPTNGYRVLVIGTLSGAFVGHANTIAQGTGSGWTFTVPVSGMLMEAKDTGYLWYYNGTAWQAYLALPASSVQGDLYYNNGTTLVRLAPGTAGQVLQTGGAGANPSWVAAPTGLPGSPVQGNIIYYNGSAWVVLAPGTAGQVLQCAGSGANPAWANPIQRVAFSFQYGGNVLTTGMVQISIPLYFPGSTTGTLLAVYLDSADQTSGSATVDICRRNAGVPGTGDSIVGGSGTKPAIASGTYAKITSFANWSAITFAADDQISVNLTAITSLKFLTVTLVIG